MKRVLLSMTAIAAIAVASQAAHAADMPVRQPLPQQGAGEGDAADFQLERFYVGLHGGYGWGRSQFDATVPGPEHSMPTAGCSAVLLGVNYQVGQTVFGLETDMNWSDMSGSAACGRPPAKRTCRGSARRARGSAMPPIASCPMSRAVLPMARSKPMFRVSAPRAIPASAGPRASAPNMRSRENMSWKTEYLYMDLGKLRCSPAGRRRNVKFNSHTCGRV
jgi:hypothetical protein